MKTFILPFIFLLSLSFLGTAENQSVDNTNNSVSPCTRACAVKGQEIFDYLFIDQDWSYDDAHDYSQDWQGDCHTNCNGGNVEMDQSWKKD